MLLESGTLDLQGKTLVIYGHLIHSGGTLNLNSGKLIVVGDYRIQKPDGKGGYAASGGILSMTNAADYVQVGGAFVTDSSIQNHYYPLSNGVLEVKGDFTQMTTTTGNSQQYNFYATDKHKVILSGTGKQVVSFEDASYSHFNTLESKNSMGLDFTSRVTVARLFEHNRLPFTLIDAANSSFVDFDGDGMKDNVDPYPQDKTNTSPDRDKDGVPDDQDAFPDDPTESKDTDSDNIGNNADPDDDNDGMLDTWENQYGLNPLDASDASTDLDGDGITNLNEYKNGTDPSQKNDLRPDLQVTDVQVPASIQVGKTVSIPLQVKNAGAGAATASTLGLWLSADDTLNESTDIALDSVAIPALPAGQSESLSIPVKLPGSASGTPYLLLQADNAHAVDESDETNNLIKKQVAIINNPPVASDSAETLDENTETLFTLKGEDPEGGELTYTIVTQPQHGAVSKPGSLGKILYIPNPDYNGADSFTFTVSDGVSTSSPATVSLTINPVDEKAADLAVTLSMSSNATPDTLTKHTITVTNTGNVEAAGVVLDIIAPAALQDLGNGNSRSRTETVAFNLSQGAAECPLSHIGTSAVCPPLPDSVDGFALHTFNLGTIPAGQSVTVDVTNRYSGYAAGNTLQILATARTTSPETAKDNNDSNQSFSLQAKRLLQGCDYRNLANVSPYPQTLGSRIANHFHALTFTANDNLPLTLFGYSDAGQQAMLAGDGFRWQGMETYGTYPAQLWAVAKPEVGSRHVGVAVSGGLYWSDDRMSWTAIAAYQSMALYDITHAKGRYVAVGAQGAILTSSDGLNWQQATSGTIANLAYVDYGNNEFVAGGQGVILTSPDGVVWTSRTSNAGQGDAALEHGAVWNGSQYLLFDAAGDTHILATSLDKLTAAIPFKPTVDGVVETASTRNWSAIHWQDNQYIALTTKGLLTSTDGRAWLSQAALDYPYAYQRFTDKAVIAGGYGGIWTAACAPVPTATASYFVEQKDVATKTLLESNTITVSGLTGVTTLTISGGEYRKNGGAYTKATGKVQNGDTLQVRHTTSTKSKTTVTTTLKVGSKALTFKSTTLVIDSVPDTFSFTALTGVARNTLVESGIVTLSGINVPIAISISGGEYRLNGGTYTKAKGTLKAGDTLQVRHLSSKSAKKTVTTTVTVGTAKVLFKSTTQ